MNPQRNTSKGLLCFSQFVEEVNIQTNITNFTKNLGQLIAYLPPEMKNKLELKQCIAITYLGGKQVLLYL